MSLFIMTMLDRMHGSLATRQTSGKLIEWKILMYPPYNSLLAPSDHKLPSAELIESWIHLVSMKGCNNQLPLFFAQKPAKFYSDKITVLPGKWKKVID